MPFLATLAALAAVAAVALALLASGDGGGSRFDPIDRGDVQSQVDDLRQFLEENTG